MTEWQPIETAPKDREIILLFENGIKPEVYQLISTAKWTEDFYGQGFFMGTSVNSKYHKILGWIESPKLPEPPETNEIEKNIIGWFEDQSTVKAFDMGNITKNDFQKIVLNHLNTKFDTGLKKND